MIVKSPYKARNTPKFKEGDLVVYSRNASKSDTHREFGDCFIVNTVEKWRDSFVYYPKNANGEYEVDLELASKLHKVLL